MKGVKSVVSLKMRFYVGMEIIAAKKQQQIHNSHAIKNFCYLFGFEILISVLKKKLSFMLPC